jgi:hypothetical protein
MCQDKKIEDLAEFLAETQRDCETWGLGKPPWFPWFRGGPSGDTPLLPKLFRKEYQDSYQENRLLQVFRKKAPGMTPLKTPEREDIDMWLFLAQHVGLPTRLLDWTEGSLIALYFALQEKESIVWMLNPFALNCLSAKPPYDSANLRYNIHSMTHCHPNPPDINIGFENIRSAWGGDNGIVEFPVAIIPTYTHARMVAQRSCFTVHGKDKGSLNKIVPANERGIVLKSYSIDSSNRNEMLVQLKRSGISRITLFPEIDVLAGHLTELFRPDLVNEKQE